MTLTKDSDANESLIIIYLRFLSEVLFDFFISQDRESERKVPNDARNEPLIGAGPSPHRLSVNCPFRKDILSTSVIPPPAPQLLISLYFPRSLISIILFYREDFEWLASLRMVFMFFLLL
jgi:hypothetical protein